MKRFLMVLALLAACKEEAAPPTPVAMTEESVGYFCQMNIMEHPGPKAQIHLASFPGKPLFFSQVRDALAYLRLPEQIDTVTGSFVSDMGVAANWAEPGAMNWIAVDAAVFVVGSDMRGGMDAPEVVPFGDQAKAEAFVAAHGGQIMALADIPAEALIDAAPEGEGDGDFGARLRALAPKPGG